MLWRFQIGFKWVTIPVVRKVVSLFRHSEVQSVGFVRFRRHLPLEHWRSRWPNGWRGPLVRPFLAIFAEVVVVLWDVSTFLVHHDQYIAGAGPGDVGEGWHQI